MIKNVEKIVNHLEEVIMEKFGKNLSGTCYLFGHCINEVLTRKSFVSRKVTGKLALLVDNSNKGKYAYFGSLNLKGKSIGYYHTWCEVLIDDDWYVVDPSIKHNKKVIKEKHKITISKNIPGFILSNKMNNYHYKYYEDMTLDNQSLSYLNRLGQNRIDNIINLTVERINLM